MPAFRARSRTDGRALAVVDPASLDAALNFGDRLHAAVQERASQLVLGLDPDPAALLQQASAAAEGDSPAKRAAGAVESHCRALIEATASACVGIKFQLACFERLGGPGWQALARSIAAAKDAGLIAIADGKRGDVPHTASAYAQALTGETPTPWGAVRGLDADAATANPLLGRDAIEPIVAGARAQDAGTFVLVRTSNPGAAELQDEPEGDQPLHLRLAKLVDEIGRDGVGEHGLSDVGAVVAATEPRLLARLRDAMPQAILLLPGVGAQGGEVEALAAAFDPGPAAALVTAARSLVSPAITSGNPADALDAAQRLREATWSMSGA